MEFFIGVALAVAVINYIFIMIVVEDKIKNVWRKPQITFGYCFSLVISWGMALFVFMIVSEYI